MPDYSDHVALITGSATGVGRACALRFAEQGFNVVINYSKSEAEALKTASEAKDRGANVLVQGCDVADDRAVRAMIAKINDTFGRLDVLVNNAATTSFVPHSELEKLNELMWDRMLDVNLKGPFFVTRAAADLLQAGDGGSVVNISSVAGITGSGSSIAYCATKGGLNTMTKSLARVMAPKVRVNAVCPGPIDSRWIKEGNPSWDLDEMTAGYPIPKASTPDDICDAVIFFALGTGMTTGQLLPVDGGQTLLP
ncbi:SDR family NAD(P)-dependent oxidoreductase [Planctomycetes bacterium K23_9]|uniref:Enoyl-[acyl-carrier-protein] reductase [NADPH] FabL n=1 Tax=Stieleria marina TaxID=1930275 RepID=A0A517NU79_9BACT|nr:Enoyl-[acyl-carrier-protein] reductase [NADPH] FabL [Planctomycetes bacterium K23_9]